MSLICYPDPTMSNKRYPYPAISVIRYRDIPKKISGSKNIPENISYPDPTMSHKRYPYPAISLIRYQDISKKIFVSGNIPGKISEHY